MTAGAGPEKAESPDTGDRGTVTEAGADAAVPEAVGSASEELGGPSPDTTADVARPEEPTVPTDPRVKGLQDWAGFYLHTFGWAVAPIWKAHPDEHRCYCPEGEACPNPGKHLVTNLGTAHQVSQVPWILPGTDPRVTGGLVGLAALTGSESALVVLDVAEAFELTRARFGLGGAHVLTQTTPSGGQHWFFKLEPGEAVIADRREVELVSGVLVLGEGGWCALGPRAGYKIIGGNDAMRRKVGKLPEPIRAELAARGLLTSKTSIHQDEPWRTRPGSPLIGQEPRSYSRDGDLRRLVDEFGDRITLTPGLGYRNWTETGWSHAERAEMDLKRYARMLPGIHRREADEANLGGKDDLAKRARGWAKRAAQRATGSILSDLASDERLWIPSADHWDNQGWICGLPVRAGVGRLANLRTGEIERDALTRRVSRYLGADYDPVQDGTEGTLKQLWERGVAGEPGHWFVKYVTDLERRYGTEWVRLLQRAAGASLYGRAGVNGDTDAVFVLKGPARSGKSTFVECLLKVAGDYGKGMNHNLLFGDKGNPEFADAAIFGYRLLTFGEPPLGVQLNTTRLKALSGGDSITGRLPYGRQEVSFTPECSLWLSTNHALEVTDEAVWRRLKIFTFEHSITEGEEEPGLRAALLGDPEEKRLALAWMLWGAVQWETGGWGDTTLWRDTTANEKSKHDPIEKWLNETIEITGDEADTFLLKQAITSFNAWVIMSEETKPKLTASALRDEIEDRLGKAGCRIDRRAGRLHRARLT